MIILPADNSNDISTVVSSLRCSTAVKKCKVEPVGRWYLSYIDRRNKNKSLSRCSVDDSSSGEESNNSDFEEKPEDVTYLRSLDPKNWKDQDHYAVLGLQKLRFRSTENDIKKAYRRKVLKHHPDKRKNAGETILDQDNDYYSCITKAYEILGNILKKRSYDSVDPEFDNSVPPDSSNSRQNFFKVFPEIFERNSRWSKKKNVPSLGHPDSSFDEVNHFYSFWYDFDSWREYSYLDDEEKEKGENRDERRWIEKQNKAARQKLKKEEMSRIRELVDNAYACDPRIQKFKEDQKEKKLALKRAKQEMARAKAEEEQKIKQEALEAEKKERERKEEELRNQAAALKKEKEALRKAFKKERKLLRTFCTEANYFADSENVRVEHMTELDKLCELMPLERLQSVNKTLAEKSDERKTIFLAAVKELNSRLEEEKMEQIEATQKSSSSNSDDYSSSSSWTHDDVQLLIKAVNLFPAGTTARWEVIANFINVHTSSSNKRYAKEVLAKAKSLQKLDAGMKEEANKQAFSKFEKSQKSSTVSASDESKPTERFDSAAELQGINPASWTSEEQKLLEQALKTYPSSTPERWEKIADTIPNRTKKDCMKRYKELVELVKAKKAAQASVSKKK